MGKQRRLLAVSGYRTGRSPHDEIDMRDMPWHRAALSCVRKERLLCRRPTPIEHGQVISANVQQGW